MNIKDMVGKKITCEIDGIIVDDAMLQKEDRWYYICQNVRTGSIPSDTLGYKYGWCIYDGSDDELRDTCVTNLKLAEWEPKRGDRVLVNDGAMHIGTCNYIWGERIFLSELHGANRPYICVSERDETDYVEGKSFEIWNWKRMKPLEPKPETKKKWARAAFIMEGERIIIHDDLYTCYEDTVTDGLQGVIKVIYPACFDEDGYLIEDITVEEE